MLTEQFKTGFQIGAVGRSQFKIQDQTAHCDQQMQPVTEESLLFRDGLAKRGVIGFPVACRTRNYLTQGSKKSQLD